jgi:hypothetical protein
MKFARMCLIFIFFLASSSPLSRALATESVFVMHQVLEDETAWFLASVYYGHGDQYTKLLDANHLSRPEDMKEGMEIRIEAPRFSEHQADFKQRYTRLWEARQKALGLNSNQSKVNLATDSIRTHDRTAKLPFNESQRTSDHGD